jgi:hypothetical protein
MRATGDETKSATKLKPRREMKFIISALTAIVICTAVASAADNPVSEEDYKKAFKKLDTNHDGFISLGEWRAAGMLDPTKTDAAFKAKNKKGDGKLSYEEFKAGAGGSSGAAGKPKFTAQQVERRLKELKDLLDHNLITEDFYEQKVAECKAGK